MMTMPDLTMPDLAIRPVTHQDAPAIAAIYNHYVRETTVTFEETEVTDAEMASRLATASDTHPWLVGEMAGVVIGYAYARKYHERAAYRHTVETAIYLDHRRHGAGAGDDPVSRAAGGAAAGPGACPDRQHRLAQSRQRPAA